jgi:hypothetical protein
MKKYKRFFEYKERKKPKVLYHATSVDYVEDILKNGLKPSWDGFVYLMEKPEAWHAVVLEVVVPDARSLQDWREAWYDDDGEEFDMDHQYDKDNPYWIYLKHIPAKYIKLHENL